MLQNLNLLPRYNSDYHNLLDEFYIPALKKASSYDRAVAYFSSNILLDAAEGLSVFVKNNGKIRH